MKISYNWLHDYIDTGLNAAELAETLTSIGLEVEEVEKFTTAPEGLHDLVIGEVLETWPHPNADRLSLTKVNVGKEEPLQIVCGAPNVAAGQKVVVAMDGTTIHPIGGEPFKIKRSKIRGELSEGMICAEDEIGLGSDHAGIMVLPSAAPIGIPFSEFLKPYYDTSIEIGLTPNRVDAASHIGIARDLAAALNKKVRYPNTDLEIQNGAGKKSIIIEIKSPKDCPRYSGLVVRNIEVKESPDWLKNYLKAAGLNPINNIVDITNFVMYEMGQPIHAFDLSAIKGEKIIIKQAQPGSKFITLDKQERTLDGSELMICNAEEPMAMAGVFGGLRSGINNNTKDIFIESAYFHPSAIRNTSRKHGLFTDASFRYERGADPQITLMAAARVAKLVQELAGGEIEDFIYDEYPAQIEPNIIDFPLSYLDKVAGMKYDSEAVKRILRGLEIDIIEEKGDLLRLRIPTFKVDVTRPIDVVEEVMRIYSIDKISFSKAVRSVLQSDPYAVKEKKKERLTAFLLDRGFSEAYVLSFSKAEENAAFSETESIKLLNPLSNEMVELRNNMLIPGLNALQYNLNRQQESVRFFKWGHTYSLKNSKPEEKYRLGIWLTGNTIEANWHDKGRKADFYYLKGIVDAIIGLSGLTGLQFGNYTDKRYEYAATFSLPSKEVVIFGKIGKKLLKQFDIQQDVYFAELDAEMLLNDAGLNVQYSAISRFPKVERDLALLVPEAVRYADIKEQIEKVGGRLLKSSNIFDVYQGEQVQLGMRSYAIRLEFEDVTRTLEDKIVDSAIQRMITQLEQNLNVKVRQ